MSTPVDRNLIFEETCEYNVNVTLSIARGMGKGTPSLTEFHNDILTALRDHFNKPTTPFYVSSVSVVSKTLHYPNGGGVTIN